MFCSHCGKQNLNDTNYCHKCGSKIHVTGNKMNIPESKSGETSNERASTSSSESCTTGNTITPTPITFAQFRASKEDDRNKHYKKKDGKRVKLSSKSESSDVKINVGIMVLKDEALVIKKGATLPLTVPATITYDNLLTKAGEKHHRFNKGIIKHDCKRSYYLLFSDKSKATTLPGCNEAFTLKRYKEEIDKPYTRITLYLCPSSDHFTSIWNDLDRKYDTEGSYSDTNQEIAETSCKIQPY